MRIILSLALGATLLCALEVIAVPSLAKAEADLWAVGRSQAVTRRFSTHFTAHDVKNYLSKKEGIDQAIDWCKRTAVTKVYIETFRDGYQAERATLLHAKERFLVAGFEVSGCVTTRQVGKKSSRWNIIACYTDQPTQARLQSIFEFTASLFDEIMIDDFWFTDCSCPECDSARLSKTVTIGGNTFPVSGDSWENYRGELMVRLSRERVLGAAKRVNPKARLIIKYPQWYDTFHVTLDAANVHVLPVKGDPKSLLQLRQKDLDELRASLLRPFKASLNAPNQVAFYLFRDGSWVIENFNDSAANIELNGKALTVAARGWLQQWN